MEKIYGVKAARKGNARGSLVFGIPSEAVEDLGIKAGDKFIVGVGKEGLTYQKRKE